VFIYTERETTVTTGAFARPQQKKRSKRKKRKKRDVEPQEKKPQRSETTRRGRPRNPTLLRDIFPTLVIR
jgi:hypothetical protein